MKRAFEEGWGGVIAKTVSLDSSKVRHALQASTHILPRQASIGSSDPLTTRWARMAFRSCCQDCILQAGR